MADRDGLEPATMRRVAQELGVGTMTLYSYFASKDELFEAVIEQVAAAVRIPSGSGPWRPRLRALVMEIHRSLLEHPSGVELRLKRPILSLAALRTTEAGLQILRGAGFGPAEAARAWRALFLYAFGSAAFNPAGVSAATRREWAELLSSLPSDEFPALSGAASEAVAAMSGQEQFEYGLDRLLDGLRPPRRRGGLQTSDSR